MSTSGPRPTLEELGALVLRAREAKGWGRRRASKEPHGPASPETWAAVEKGQQVQTLTYAGIERVLGWPTGSMLAYLDGGPEPVAIEPVDGVHQRQKARSRGTYGWVPIGVGENPQVVTDLGEQLLVGRVGVEHDRPGSWVDVAASPGDTPQIDPDAPSRQCFQDEEKQVRHAGSIDGHSMV